MTSQPLPPQALKRRKLPIGIQTFRKLIEQDCYYVDKTGIALNLIDQGSCYFLSRPRRFGKRLFLDTLKDLFEGHQELFTGLAAETRWDWSVKYPVIRISFGAGNAHSRAELDAKLTEQLDVNEQALGMLTTQPTISGRFSELIRLAHAQAGQRVVGFEVETVTIS
jgi:hypothetical protein